MGTQNVPNGLLGISFSLWIMWSGFPDSIWNASASSRRFCFFVRATCFVLHGWLIYHTFSVCQVQFWIFFKIFSDSLIHASWTFEEHHVFAWSFNISRFSAFVKCSFKNFSNFFEKLLEEHRASCKSRKTSATRLSTDRMPFRFHHKITFSFKQHPASTGTVSRFPSDSALIYHRFFICQTKIEKKSKKSWNWTQI